MHSSMDRKAIQRAIMLTRDITPSEKRVEKMNEIAFATAANPARPLWCAGD